MPEPVLLDAVRDLATETTSQRFDGAAHDVDVSFFLNHTAPGRGARPHRHAYAEVFVVQEGEATFVVDGGRVVAHGGHIVVVPAGAVHAFTNSGERTLEMVSIHPVASMETEWIEEP